MEGRNAIREERLLGMRRAGPRLLQGNGLASYGPFSELRSLRDDIPTGS